MRKNYLLFGGCVFTLLLIWGSVAYAVKTDIDELELYKVELAEKGFIDTGESFEKDGIEYHKILVPVKGKLVALYCPCVQGALCWPGCAGLGGGGEEQQK